MNLSQTDCFSTRDFTSGVMKRLFLLSLPFNYALVFRFWCFGLGLLGCYSWKAFSCEVHLFLRHFCTAIRYPHPRLCPYWVHAVFLDRQAWQLRACSLIVAKPCLNWQQSTIGCDSYLLGPFRRKKERSLPKVQKRFTLHRSPLLSLSDVPSRGFIYGNCWLSDRVS